MRAKDALPAFLQHLQHRAQGGNAGHVFGARSAPALLPATGHQGGVGAALAHIQHANAFGRIQLVARKRRVVDTRGLQVQRKLAQRLHTVHQPQGAGTAGLQQRLDACNIRHHPGFIVGRNGAQQRGSGKMRFQKRQVMQALGIDRHREHRQVQAQQAVPVRHRLRHRLVLGGAQQNRALHPLTGIAPRPHRAQRGQHRRLDALSGAAHKQQLALACPQHPGGLRTHAVQQRLGPQAGAVAAAGVAELAHERAQGSVARSGQHRCGGIAVQVNLVGRCVHGSPQKQSGMRQILGLAPGKIVSYLPQYQRFVE